MNRTNIPYLDFTWNPLVMRCTRVSTGCENCWHHPMADRLAANPMITRETQPAYTGEIEPLLIEKRLAEVYRRKKPAMIGVQFMGDLFHRAARYKDTAVLGAICDNPQHTFLVLTKRPHRAVASIDMMYGRVNSMYVDPIPNLWLGTSVENQETADERLSKIFKIPAAVHVISVEPMLEKIDLDMMGRNYGRDFEHWSQHVDWVICGDESGSNRRPVDLDAVRDLRDQCIQADVPFFLKQLHIDGERVEMPKLDGRIWNEMPEGMVWCPICGEVGKKTAGRISIAKSGARLCAVCDLKLVYEGSTKSERLENMEGLEALK